MEVWKNIPCPNIVPMWNLGKGRFIFINADFWNSKNAQVFCIVAEKEKIFSVMEGHFLSQQ